MMDELPAIIHRLSLRLWCPESGVKEEEERAQAETKEKEEIAINPLDSPPQDAVDARGNVLDANEISNLQLDGGSETQSLFSQKNLLKLSALTDSHRTLSLFTPSIRDAVFRAWAGPTERGDTAGSSTPIIPLVRSHSSAPSTSTTYTFNKSSDDGHGHMPSRPSLVSLNSATTGLALGAGRHSRSHMRKKKNRVVNLRRSKTTDDVHSESGESENTEVHASEPAFSTYIPEEPEDNILTPPKSPSSKVRFRTSSIDLGDSPRKLRPIRSALSSKTVPEQAILEPAPQMTEAPAQTFSRENRPSYTNASSYPVEKASSPASGEGSSVPNHPFLQPAPVLVDSSAAGGILEQAWVMKMAGEIARRAHDEKAAREGFWSSQSQAMREDSPPPAYEPKAL